jgi:hypothetical protein
MNDSLDDEEEAPKAPDLHHSPCVADAVMALYCPASEM